MGTREELLTKLRTIKPRIERDFSVADLWVFGSRAREEARQDSDLDLLVRFTSRKFTLLDFLRLEDELATELGIPVDLVDIEALRKDFRPQVMREVVLV